MIQYKIIGSNQLFNDVNECIEYAKGISKVVGYKPEIRKVKDGITMFESVQY